MRLVLCAVVIAAASTACTKTETKTTPGGDAATLDGLDSTAFARVDDLAPLATRTELAACATRDDLAPLATRTELAAYATRDDLAGYATTGQLASYVTRTELDAACVPVTDPRLSDARTPLPGSAAYVQSQSAVAQPASFRVSGTGAVGTLAVAGDAQLGGSLVVAGTITGRVASATSPPVACGAAQAGHVYLDPVKRSFYGCDGVSWTCLGGTCKTARSCRDLLAAGTAGASGVYTVEGTYGPYQVYCDMVADGGGWTLVISSAWDATFMAGDSPRWAAEDGTDSPANALSVDHKATAFDQVASWGEVRVTTSTGSREFVYRYPLQTKPLRALFAAGRAVVGTSVLNVAGTYAGRQCAFPVLNETWNTSAGAMTLRIGAPEPDPIARGDTTSADFPCGPGDTGAGTARPADVGPYWPGREGLGFVNGAVGGRAGFASCGAGTSTYCDPGETPRIHVWVR